MEKVKTIYIVDDDPDDCMFIREAIEDAVSLVRIIEIWDGKELLDLLSTQDEEQYPSLIILDMNMPRMNGLEALKSIKSHAGYAHIPVLMLSTTSNPQLVNQAYSESVSAFLIKPQTSEEFALMSEAVISCFLHRYPSARTTAKPSLKNQHMLIVEDNPDQLQMMNLAIKQATPELQIHFLSDAESTQNFLLDDWKLLKKKPQIVLLDLYLPTREDGLRTLDTLRNFFHLHQVNIPIIVISSSDHEEDIKACYVRKANCFLTKPRDGSQWLPYFKGLQQVWWGPITLPR